jgi:DNA-binding FadR family transcriptional regulator
MQYGRRVESDGVDRRLVVQQVAERLREAVVDAVKTATQFPGETALSRSLTVSRPTLREALRILEAEGLVRRDNRTSAVRPDAGTESMSRPLRSALTVLTQIERITLAEIVDLRATIEGRAVERASEVATPEDLERLLAALEAEREAGLGGGDWDQRAFEFHLEMVRASHNEAFLLVMLAAREAAADLLERAAQSALRSGSKRARSGSAKRNQAVKREWVEEQYQQHLSLYEAIRDGRGSEARDRLWAVYGRYYEPLLETDPLEARRTGLSQDRDK